MMDWAEKKMKALGIETQQVDIGNQTFPDGSELKLPNVILGTLGNVSKSIALILSHQLHIIFHSFLSYTLDIE